jgi:hypothetical protein
MDGLRVKSMGLSFGIVSAISMAILGILGNLGIYLGAVEMMSQWHAFFNLSFWGIIFGMIEAFVIGGIIGVGIAYFYNLFEI